MSDSIVPLDHDALSELLSDPTMLRIVTVVNLARLSILELLEYGLTHKDINRAMAKGIIEFDKPSLPAPETASKGDIVQRALETGDYYFGLLSSRVRLAKLGLYMLEIIESDGTQAVKVEGYLRHEEIRGLYSSPAPHI